MADSAETPGAGTYELGPSCGRVLVKTGRDGLAARAGHDLTIEITRWSARVSVPDSGDGGAIAGTTVTAELDLGSLVVREGRGGAKPLSDRDRRDIQGTASTILGPAATASFASSRVLPSAGTSPSASPSSGVIEGTLTLHGTSKPLGLQVGSLAPRRYRGSATVRQTDYGIKPYSGFFGALKLRDEILVEFEVELGETPVSLPDLESADPLGLFRRHANVLYDGEARTAVRPLHQVAHVLGGPLEDGLDTAIRPVPHPAAHAVLLGHPQARGTEGHTLHATRNLHPIANHTDTVRCRNHGRWPATMSMK
jgi:hypothetical protein